MHQRKISISIFDVDESPTANAPTSEHMARGDTLHRALKVIRLLELNPQGLTVNELEDHLKNIDDIEVVQKTIRRDLDVISTCGFPLTHDRETSKYKLEPIAKITKTLAFSYEELLALYLTKESFESQRGSPLYNNLRSFFSRLEEVLGPKAHQGLKELKQYVGIKPEPSWSAGVPEEVMETVHQACAEGHYLQIEYRPKQTSVALSASALSPIRKVGPEAIYFADAGVYLVAKDQDGVHKLFALGRVRSATMLPEAYTSDGFNLTEFLKDGIGVLRLGEVEDVHLKVREPIASYISERRWHESQVVTRVPDGIELKLRVRVNDELARWVLGLGPDAEVIKPSTLSDRVNALASAIVNRKKTKAS